MADLYITEDMIQDLYKAIYKYRNNIDQCYQGIYDEIKKLIPDNFSGHAAYEFEEVYYKCLDRLLASEVPEFLRRFEEIVRFGEETYFCSDGVDNQLAKMNSDIYQ